MGTLERLCLWASLVNSLILNEMWGNLSRLSSGSGLDHDFDENDHDSRQVAVLIESLSSFVVLICSEYLFGVWKI